MAQDGNAARTIEGLPPPVEGPAVWYGPDMAKRTEWVHALSAEDLGDVATVVCGDGSVLRSRAWADAGGAPPTITPAVTPAQTASAAPMRRTGMGSLLGPDGLCVCQAGRGGPRCWQAR